ncbi:MAG: redoxin domain-containing protein [Candidatus Eisenbacteria bacterium]|nr:redoxin domain-containing protein [Candidatus Eisenbacteria bacterium]
MPLRSRRRSVPGGRRSRRGSMRGHGHRRAVWLLGCLTLGLVALGVGCDSSTDPNGDEGEQVPDFVAEDVNSFSDTFGQDLQFSEFASGKATLLYFGRSTCEGCRAQYAAIDTIVAELTDEGYAVTGAMVNHHLDRAYAYYLDGARAEIPAFQDTLAVIDEQNVPRIGYLLSALEGDELLVIDSSRRLQRTERIGESHEYDLRELADRATVKSWIRDLF